MMDDNDYDSTDSSDEEYIPSDAENLSEEEGSGEEEDLGSLQKDADQPNTTNRAKKRKAKPVSFLSKKKGGIRLEGEKAEEEDTYNKELEEKIKEEKKERKNEDQKKKADSLWADFLKDVDPPKAKQKTSSSLGSINKASASNSKTSELPKKCTSHSSDSAQSNISGGEKNKKVTITTQYDFAGEIVTVTKEVDSSSKEAKKVTEAPKAPAAQSLPGVRRVGGLGSVLGKIGNKPKMGTLEKSKLDWDSFKKKEGIEEELQIHNRGKEGYVERQRFLERTDVRQFEIEKSIRLSSNKT